MARKRPSIRPTETYTESNFIRLHTAAHAGRTSALRKVTIEHMRYDAHSHAASGGWRCETIVDCEAMSRDDALFIADAYARENDIPVIYECHSD